MTAKNQPVEVLLKGLFDSPLAGDTEKRAIAATYGYIKKLRRRIKNQAREINRLQEKLEGAEPERLSQPAVDDTEAA